MKCATTPNKKQNATAVRTRFQRARLLGVSVSLSLCCLWTSYL